MEELFPVVLFVLWVAAGILGAARRKRGERPRPRPRSRPRASSTYEAPSAPAARTHPRRQKETVFERFRRELEELQAEMERAQAEAARGRTPGESAGPLGRPARVVLEGAEEVEELETLEEEPEVVSLEEGIPDRSRRVVVLDEGAEAVALRRIREAQARDRPLTARDHREFDARIRAAAAEAAPKPRPIRASIPLRQAIIWREILGPPVALSASDPVARGPHP